MPSSPLWLYLRQLSALLMVVVLWQLASWGLTPELLPGPARVIERGRQLLLDGPMLQQVMVTLYRVAVAFVCSMLLGSALGFLVGRFTWLNSLCDPLLVVLLNVPALVVIFLCFITLGLNDVAAITAVVINKTPNVVVTLREGTQAVDRQLLEVARVFRLSRRAQVVKIYLPQLYPYLLAAMRNGLPLVWKIILVVELIGCSDGVGFELGVYFQYFDISAILAYTLVFVLVVFAVEYAALRPLEKRMQRWR